MIDGDCSGRRRSKKRKSSTGNALQKLIYHQGQDTNLRTVSRGIS